MISIEQTQHDGDGSTMYTRVSVTEDGGLKVEIHDLGPVTRPISPDGEYEAVTTWSGADAARIVEALGGRAGDTLGDLLSRWDRDNLSSIAPAIRAADIQPSAHWSWS